MGHDKLRKFAENETFPCLLQPSSEELLADGFFSLRDHPLKGHWAGFFDELKRKYALREGSVPDSAVCEAVTEDRRLILELGCGKGEYTVALAERDRDGLYVGVDIKGARLWKGAKYATEKGLGNVGFLRTRVEFISAFFAPGEVSEIWLTFSDPQYRSENSRLTSPVFLERYRNFLRPDGIVHLKTDSRFLYEYTREVCRANSLTVLACTGNLYGDERGPEIPRATVEVQTFYEKMFLEQGYRINYISFRLDGSAPLVHPENFDEDYWRSVEGPRLLFGHDSAETRRQKKLLPLHNHAEGEE